MRRTPLSKRKVQRKKRAVPPPQPPARKYRWREVGFLALVLILATALRATHLTSQSMWADEGNSVRLTERPLPLVIAAARADVHPPGYYLLLWIWARLFGMGEAAMRGMSVVIGVALVWVVYLIGKRLFGGRGGWLAAFCAAVSPFQVRYSQEVRMYILVALLGATAGYAFIRWIEREEPRRRRLWGALYVAAVAGGLWTHYLFPVVVVALNLAWVAWWLGGPERKREAALWIGLQLASLILYLPWLPVAWDKMWGYGPISESHSPGFVLASWLQVLSIGEAAPSDEWSRWLTVGIVGLALFGAWSGLVPTHVRGDEHRRQVRIATVGLILLALAPAVLMIALSLGGRPAYRPKFFIVASPAFCLLTGAGIALLERPAGGRHDMSSRLWLLVGVIMVSLGAVRSLRNYYFDPRYARSDYRGIAAYIQSRERAGDAILLDAPNQWEVFTYYYHGLAQVYPVCRSRPPREEKVAAELRDIAIKHKRLFALYWATAESDPQRIVERWLAANAFKAGDTWYGDVRLTVYALPDDLSPPEMAHSLPDTRLGDEIALRGYTVAPSPVHPGDILRVTLFWQALSTPARRYKVFLHLVNAEGRLVAQYDEEPGDGMDLTVNWRPERGIVADRCGVWLPDSLPAGSYLLSVGMYDLGGGPRLPLVVDGEPAGDALTLCRVEVR